MAKCEYCEKDMLKVDGCDTYILTLNDGKDYPRILVGDEEDLYYGYDDEEFRCPDCNAKVGYPHHEGCDAERCPKCYEQLMSCDC